MTWEGSVLSDYCRGRKCQGYTGYVYRMFCRPMEGKQKTYAICPYGFHGTNRCETGRFWARRRKDDPYDYRWHGIKGSKPTYGKQQRVCNHHVHYWTWLGPGWPVESFDENWLASPTPPC